MIEAALAMGGLGLFAGVGLGIASKVFHVEVDPRITAIEEALPGANCGGCGYAGCSGAAEAISVSKAEVNICVAGGPEVYAKIAEIMGVSFEAAERKYAILNCRGGERADKKYIYEGVDDCRAAVLLYGGEKDCNVGCIGLGTCVKSCKFDAVKIGDEGIPVFNEMKCVGCGTCVNNCPKGILSLVTERARLMHFNSSDEGLAPCQQTCPAQINIPKYINHIKNGEYDQALYTIKERNPLPLVCGRVCPHPCEFECRRRHVDDSVNINHLKRFAADYEMYERGSRLTIPVAPDTGKSVAVIGGGPAGISAAFYLRRLGHDVTIFEAMPNLGGMTRYGIPEYRLPKKILDWEIQGILDMGIVARTDMALGKDYTVADLRLQGFDAILMAEGAWGSRGLGVDGEESEGVLSGIDFLIDQDLTGEIRVGSKVAIIGGGNTAIDASRTSLRMGADEVTIIYRRSRAEMPANDIEVEEAEREGVKFHFLAAPTKVITQDNKVTGIEYIKMELGEPDASGRRRPVPVDGSETVIELDNIIAAIGQFPDLAFTEEDRHLKGLKYTRWKTIEANEATLQTNTPYIFTAGDIFTGPATVVAAIGGGRRAARSIDMYLRGEEVLPPENELQKLHPESEFEDITGIDKSPREKMPELEPEEREHNYNEVELGFTEEQAIHESERCLNCCITCYNHRQEG